METWAIFTGDIVKSTAMTRAELDAVFARLEEAADAVATWQSQPTRMTRFRGDGWQMAVAPQFTFRAALVLRAAVRRSGKTADTRFGIGLGDAHFAGDDLSRADGSALVRSGHALDAMPRARRMNAPDAALGLRAALPLADRIAGRWTMRQADVAYYMLAPEPPVQASLAQQFDLTQQSVQGHVDAAGIDELREVCDILEERMTAH
ncbi:hypothetical protein DSM14862_01221 [Sulfitobacter indolifex]|uniref:MarR family transcriptional regulator n=1 Tax=Sulfitobacter indolifex HEL-45 TaxID=391624 RepID=A0ABM9X3E5_9RHOB|nr:hypothetical protein [Sulfitobacter indolifex]EDQ04001.1 hypothetical protein OIHEL45_11725 [Sulfitobacter indolifex HEL-45]UOA18456.1 hypothetical protein DSM14862_01221 [Sulfitobacter indolifex]